MRKWIALVIGITLLTVSMGVVACTSAATTTTSTNPERQAAIDLAKSKLAARLSIDAAKITVVSADAVDWPDTSLGVPEPGKIYAQVITPGYKVILSANGTQYEYHTGKSGAIVAK